MVDTVTITSAPHPFKVERDMLLLPEGFTLAEMLEATQPDPILRAHAVIFMNGYVIPQQNWARTRPKAGAHVEIRVLPQGGGGGGGGGGGKNPLRTILTIGVIAASFYFGPALGQALVGEAGLTIAGTTISAASVGQAVIGLAGTLLINAIAPIRPPRLPQLSGTIGTQRDSPTLFIEGARNRATPFAPVPVVLGRHRMSPPYGAAPFTEVVGDKHFIRLLFVWGHGPLSIDTDSLRIGETPITAFEGVQIEHREGRPGDDPLTLYPSAVAQQDFSILLAQTAGFQTRTSGPNADELSIDVTFPQGLVQFNDQGQRQQRSVTIEIEFRRVGDTTWRRIPANSTATFDDGTVSVAPLDAPAPTDPLIGKGMLLLGTRSVTTTVPIGQLNISDEPDPADRVVNSITFTHNRTSAIRHGFRWSVTERGQYEIRVRRTSADTDSSQIFDTLTWTALRAITDTDPIQSAVPVAKTALVIQATDQLNRVVDEFNGIVTSVGKGWVPDLPTPEWVDDREIQNPADVFRLALQGNGMAEPLPDDRIDLEGLADWHEFNTARGFKFNMVRDFATSVWDVLADIAAAGRAAPAQVDGKWTVVIEREQPVPVSHITPRNSFDFRVEKAFPDQPHGWRIRFPNEEQGYRQDERRVYRDGFTQLTATKFETLELPGVTSPDQVQRLGRFRIAQGLLQPERWTFQQDMEFLTYRRGDRVSITHDVLLVGLHSGRVKAVVLDTNDNVIGLDLDEAVIMEPATSYGIAIRTVAGGEVVREVVTNPGEHRELTLVSPIPPTNGEPTVTTGDLFGFGLLGSETDAASIISIQPDQSFRAQVIAVPYRPAIFTADTEVLPVFETNLTPLPVIPAPVVRSVVSDESALALGPGESLRTRIAVEFDPLEDPRLNNPRVEAQYRQSSTGEPFFSAQVDSSDEDTVILSGVHEGETWDIRLRHVVDGRLPGPWTNIFGHRVIGKSTPPAELSNLTISVFGGQAMLRWDRPSELDVAFGGEVQFRHSPLMTGATWQESTSIGEAARARSLIATLPLKPGTYLARVFDVAGNPSTDVTTVTTKQASVLAFADLDTLNESPAFGGEHDGTFAEGGTLRLLGADAIDDWGLVDEVADWDSEGGIILAGTYSFQFGFDLGDVKRVRLTTRITATSVNVLDQIDSREDNIDAWEDFDGTQQAAADARVFVRHTDDDPAATGAVFGDWERLDSAEFEARGFQFELRLTTNDPAFNIVVSELGVDVEEVT